MIQVRGSQFCVLKVYEYAMGHENFPGKNDFVSSQQADGTNNYKCPSRIDTDPVGCASSSMNDLDVGHDRISSLRLEYANPLVCPAGQRYVPWSKDVWSLVVTDTHCE